MRRLPSMYHQFKELAGVDITKEPMEVGPTAHYMNGGIRVDADSTATAVPGLFAAGEVAGGLHGGNRLGGNALSDLLVFGRRAGQHAALYAKSFSGVPTADTSQLDACARETLMPFEGKGAENPHAFHAELQETMQPLVGIIRTETELQEALVQLRQYRQRLPQVRVEGGRTYNPGWHAALDLNAMLTVAECVTRAALERKESRGGHTRDDYPVADPRFASVNVVIRKRHGAIITALEPTIEMPEDLRQLIEEKG
jgi:succinate dehydrogenase / fumarate reductase flavoprotein subunit